MKFETIVTSDFVLNLFFNTIKNLVVLLKTQKAFLVKGYYLKWWQKKETTKKPV